MASASVSIQSTSVGANLYQCAKEQTSFYQRVEFHHVALPTNLLVTMGPSAFPSLPCAAVIICIDVMIIHTHLLHSVMIVLVNASLSVRNVANKFAFQMKENAMAL